LVSNQKLLGTLKRHAPEFITIAIVAIAIVGIELRRQAITLAPEALRWSPSEMSASYPRALFDAAGTRLTITARPRRIVSETLGSDELLFGTCAGDQLVGVSSIARDPLYSNVVEQARERELPSTNTVEQIVELRPDLVFVASYSPAEQVELLRSTGINVFRISNFDRIQDIMGNVRTVGYATGNDRCAAALIARMNESLGRVAAIASKHTTAPRLMEYGTAGYTAGAHTLIDEMFRVVGARNVSAEHGIHGSLRIDSEAVAFWQPDFIVAGAPHGESEQVRRTLLADPAIGNSRAAREGRLIVIDDRFLLCVSQFIVPAIEQLSESLYGLGNPA
jgi:iron complex transport system substrate-binding protein